ncbi:hypothetical protein [Burkholderia ubonensis]|uniref:hypothetical protein n=1 Tax=Burkholderia ubonensis TaxID=101571 RepID=UPI000A406288|nr:hypothetical protein [Burkholderia ubonensis]
MKSIANWTAIALAGCCACFSQFVSAAPAVVCPAPDAWFASANVPDPDSKIPPPPDKNNLNCPFHQFSWNAFLWLTEPLKNGLPRFESFYSDAAIDPTAKNPTEHVLDGVQQAESLGIVVDQGGRAVYTNMYINDVYRNFAINNKLYTREGMKKASADQKFEIGAISLKAAWKIVGKNDDVSRFYTTTAKIKLLSKVGKSVNIQPNAQSVDVTVALVGFHIAWVAEGHPEAIWATFEHVDNAPDLSANQNKDQPVSTKSFTFYKAGTLPADCNQNNASQIQIDENTQILTPVTQVCRQYKTGGGDISNIGDIELLNAEVQKRLKEKNSVWQYYKEVGAVWLSGKPAPTLRPNWSPNIDPSIVRGSSKLSNSVIETFTQKDISKNQCFSCHNTMGLTNTTDFSLMLPGKDISTSHILLLKYLNAKQVKR